MGRHLLAKRAFVDFFGFGRNLSGVNVSELSSLGVAAVWRAVSVLSGAIANLPLKTYRDSDDGRVQVSSFLDDPGGFESMTPFEWVETVMAHLLLHGNAFLRHVHGGAGQIVHLKESLGERLRTQVEHLNPFRKITPAGRDASPDLITEMMPSAAVAVGLALRRAGD